MYKIWKKKSQEEIKNTVFNALNKNVNYADEYALGIPASYLDDKVFNQDESFLSKAPFLSTLLKNPNHIGCHTQGHSESFFKGTQEIERELIEICAVDILKGKEGEQDGYVASGGTEANIQAVWIYRNYFIQEKKADRNEICILCSDDSHYSFDKASNLLSIDIHRIPVNPDTRNFSKETITETIEKAKKQQKKYFIVISNMMTTMFGSVDDIEVLTEAINSSKIEYKLHVDGAYGGFYYPFSTEQTKISFINPHINSVTLDAHKMAQAPYGTGIFLIRKGYMKYANTKQASYVEGEDLTLCGSRSGANAVAVWMILAKNGPFGWNEKIFILQKRTEWMCKQLDNMSIKYFRNPYSNIITIKNQHISPKTASKYGLVPDNHKDPRWFKIVVMEHVTIEKLSDLLKEVSSEKV